MLKLTPHKNTPVSNKPYRTMSPQAIRKLHFDGSDDSLKNTSETKVYRNTSRGRRSNLAQKIDAASENSENLWQSSSPNKQGMPHTSHRVVNLQEPLMQNKEICFSTGIYGSKTEFDIPCIEVHENNPSFKTGAEDGLSLRPAHHDKYDLISDDDDELMIQDSNSSEQDLSPAIVKPSTDINDSRLTSPTLLDIKKRVNSDEYMSLKDFNYDMKEVIERTLNGDLKSIYGELFSETFPWFDCENNSLKPNLEVEGEHDEVQTIKDHDAADRRLSISKYSNNERPMDQIVPKLECEGDKLEELLETYPLVDSRICVLCKTIGDGFPAMEGRLLYCGQSDWIHANCALWSAEVFEEIDGSLQNVHSAISRGKMIKCATCELKGASVGCCAKNCSETYHYSCARKENCAFMDDKRVFCPNHSNDIPHKSLQRDSEFELTRPVYVELDKKKKRFSEINKVQFLLGSLTVQNLGKIVPSVSDYEDFLMPVDFMCTRLFWSCRKPLKVVRYTIKTKLILSEPLPGFDFGVNITVDHSLEIQVVDRVMAEIGAWHKSLLNGDGKKVLYLKKDKSPIKLKKGVTLEDIAVKQVMDSLIDSVCKMEQQDEEEPQNTADLLPPELKDAIFEDLNHDLLDGISMQDIFPKLMSYEDLAGMDLKNELYGAISQSDDKNIDKSERSTSDFIDELFKSSSRFDAGNKELKRSKSEMLLQNHNLKSLTTGRGQQRSSSLTWNNKFDSSLLSSTIKRCKMNRTSTATGKLSPVQRSNMTDNLDAIKEEASNNERKKKPESTDDICDEAPHTSGLTYRTTSPKDKEAEVSTEKCDKNEGYYADVIDFYTKIQCSPISQLDGACDWSGSESSCSSRPNSPQSSTDFTPISQLDGADENGPADSRNQFMFRASGTESTYTVTLAGTSVNGQPELVMRPLDDAMPSSHGQIEQLVRCDRCHCTYRNKESYDRHVPSCDMMSTSESESENPKSPESRTLTTLQNAFQNAFAQPMTILHAGVVSGSESTVKADGISARRTSINTRQITINGTIVETPSPGPSNEMTMTITEQMKSGTVIFDQGKTTNIQVSTSQQVLSSPQIVVTPQMLLPPKTSSSNNQKMITPQIITQNGGLLPYNICVKSGSGNANIQQIQSGTDMTQILSGAGSIQVLSSNSNQVLTIPSNQQGILQGQKQVGNFPNMASATSIALPVNSMPNTSLIQNIQPMIRPQIQGNTIVVPTMTTQRLASPNSQNKQIIIPGTSQKSPKKQPQPVQPKPILQAVRSNRGRSIPKPTTIKRQTKLEKSFTTINQSPLGHGNTVIQLQTNNQTGQPSIIVQPVANQNIMSYVEALSQQQNQNMQYIATIAPQNDIMKAPTQFISTQSGLMPQTFQIQQTENGGLVAVPSGGIPVLLPQGNVGILPQTLQQGATILPQGALQTQGIISQGPNGPTILPQTIHTQNGATIIPQGTIQGISPGTITSQATLLPNNTLQTGGATVVPNSGINNTQTTIIPNTALQTQGNTLISSAQGATLLPQGAILPQFCNDQVILGSTPTLEMVTDPSGCMYLTATQPVYYGLETIVQNTVMSSQQFVSTAMQGVLAQNSSFSATTTQVFQASKIEPIVEVPTGYVVVNNVDGQVSSTNITGQTVQTSPQTIKTVKTSVPNITLQPLPEKSNRQPKVIQMSPSMTVNAPGTVNLIAGRSNLTPITSQIHSMSLANTPQSIAKTTIQKHAVSMPPNVTLVSSTGQPVMAISQSTPNTASSFSMQSIPMSQPIVTTSIAPALISKTMAPKLENSHIIEISGNLQDNSTGNIPTISVPQSLKSPTPWRQINTSSSNDTTKNIDTQNVPIKGNNICANSSLNIQTSTMKMNQLHHNDPDKNNQNCIMSMSNNCNASGINIQSHQFESSINVSHNSNHQTSNNMIQITSGNIYPPSSSISTFDAETTMKLNKINALSKTEGGHMNFSQEIMASHSQHNAQSEKSFQNLPTTITADNKHNIDGVNNQMNVHKLNSCQLAGSSNQPSISIIPHNMVRSNAPNAQNSGTQNHQSQMISMTSNSHSLQMMSSNTMSNITCQEQPNSRLNNDQQSNPQHDLLSNQSTNMSQNNLQMMGHEGGINSSPNQIHIMNGQIQHNRQQDNTQMQQSNIMNQSPSNRFHDNMLGGQHNQSNIINRNSTESNISLMNQNMMHNMSNNHNNRQQNEMSHIHMQQSIGNVNNMQNNRMMLDNMQNHQINNINHQMHSTRPMDNMHNQMSHNVQQINHHSNRQPIENNMHLNSQMGMQQNRQLDGHSLHHQHSMSNMMQHQTNRSHVDNNMMNMHTHIPNQMHNRQLDNNMHMHHNSVQNSCMNSQIDNPMSQNMANNMHNRHDNSMPMQNMNVLNQMQNNNRSMEHNNMMQHQINNMNMHNNINSNMQMNNSNQQTMLHSIPDIKNDMPAPCGGSCSNNNAQFSNNQSPYEMCGGPNINISNNMNSGNMMHNMNVNNTNLSNMMMNNVNNSVFGSSMSNISNHDIMMGSCNNSSDIAGSGLISGASNHMMMNNSPNNQNQLINNQVANGQQININTNNQTLTNMDNPINRSSMNVNEPAKFVQEQLRGKPMMAQQTNNQNMTPMQSHPNNDCAKVNNPVGYMQVNASNNRIINLPERSRMNNANINNMDNNMTQHNIPQHNIRVVTNNNNNVAGISAEPLTFQKTEANSTMINVPFQAIPNSAPMNINVNSSNNTVNITVQNNLVDPKIASKAGADINFPIQAGTNLIPNQSTSSNMICIPVPNNSTINLPTQNSTSITLPIAPPTQQSGIPTNVVTPMSMRPMNRVLPLHRDGQSKTAPVGGQPSAPKTPPAPKTPTPQEQQAPENQDMPELHMKDDNIDSDLEKAIEESKRMIELEREKREKEEMEAARVAQIGQSSTSTADISNTQSGSSNLRPNQKLHSLSHINTDMETQPPKVLIEKSLNRVQGPSRMPASKLIKRPIDKKSDNEATSKKSSKPLRGQENRNAGGGARLNPDPSKDDGPKLIYEVTSEDGFNYSSTSLTDLWAKVVEGVQNARKLMGLQPIQYNLQTSLGGAHLLGLNNNALRYLVEQLPGASRCMKYKTRQGRELNSWDNDLDLSEGFKESSWGSARAGPAAKKRNHDMFSWMASPFREEPPPLGGQDGETLISRRLATLPMAMRFRHLKETSKASVGVYRSHIHGRGLFCKRDIEEGDMVIEYAGEVIRAVLADQREKLYEAMRGRRGVAGCYMFRIDDHLVVDATLKGNAARFINHSCDPNCYSRVVDIHGHKHILIFALRRITIGEELTYDYKFPFEEVKIPCTCGAKKCRKYLN